MAMNELVEIGKALADESRVRALWALRGGEVCVCQIVELLGLAPSTVSKHLSILRGAGLVVGRKQGRWMHYRLAAEGDGASAAALGAIEWALGSLAKDAAAASDAKRIKAILKMDPEALCQKQRENSGCCSSAPATPAAVRWRKDGRADSAPARSKPSLRGRSRTD